MIPIIIHNFSPSVAELLQAQFYSAVCLMPAAWYCGLLGVLHTPNLTLSLPFYTVSFSISISLIFYFPDLSLSHPAILFLYLKMDS